MKKRMAVLVLFVVLALLLCAYSPGGKGRIPVPAQYITPTLAPASVLAVTATPGMVRMPPRLRGTPLPPFCNQPGGPRC